MIQIILVKEHGFLLFETLILTAFVTNSTFSFLYISNSNDYSNNNILLLLFRQCYLHRTCIKITCNGIPYYAIYMFCI